MPAISPWEKTFGKHPAQKPLALVVRAILASSVEGNLILDPFAGSSTTGIAANLVNREFVGVEQEPEYLELSKNRRMAFDSQSTDWANRIGDLKVLKSTTARGKEK
jgi:site-specific DNA-methyltransferase (adenine-specific)